MKKNEYQWVSSEGIQLYGQSWCPIKTKPIAVVCIVHSLGEHSSRYDGWAHWFVAKGYAVTSIDYRGHGKSQGARGHIFSYLELMNDINILYQQTKNLFPSLPIILYGHGLGGNIILNYYLQYSADIRGLIVSSPWLMLAEEPSHIKYAIMRLLNKFFPKITQSTRLISKFLSHDPVMVKKYDDDRLVHRTISLRMFFEIYKAENYIFNHVSSIQIPMLVMHGTGDRITSHIATTEFVKHTTNQHTTFKTWHGFYHELHNELERDKIFEYVITWIEQVLGIDNKNEPSQTTDKPKIKITLHNLN